MAEQPKSIAEFKDWKGIFNVSPHRMPPGSARQQINLRCTIPGQADVRGGLAPVSFANGTTPSFSDVISMYSFPHSERPFVIYELSDGTVKAGGLPTV